jgi:hypothetical protein
MPKLSDSQLVVLSAACQRDGRSLYPVTLKAKGSAAAKVLKSLLAKGLIEEVPAGLNDEVWREDKDSARLTLRATDAAVAALNIEPEPKTAPVNDAPKVEKKARAATKKRRPSAGKHTKKAAKIARKKVAAKAPRATRENTKQARLIEMLKRHKGASVGEIVETLDWQPHTVRGAIAGALKKKLGLDVTSEKSDKRGRVYHIAG